MIITRTPFRVSFFGGGSDLAAFYRRSVGAVLCTTIDRCMYLSAHPYFDGSSIHLKYSATELAGRVEDVRHPIVRRVLQRLGHPGGVEITSTADVPAGTGLGSSSAFTVGLLQLMYSAAGQQVPPLRLAREACEIEIEDLGAPIGKQDQYASACGGLNFIRFFPDDTVDVTPIVISPETRRHLQSSLLMFYTGEQRSASELLSHQRQQMIQDEDTFQAVSTMVRHAHEARELLEQGDVAGFGALLHHTWQLKRKLTAQVSSPKIDAMYALARDAGAWGGKILGAGGGGFLLVAAPPSAHQAIRVAIQAEREIPVHLERGGTKVVYMSEDS